MSQRVKNEEVVNCWKEGKSASNRRGSLTTDGNKLYSYYLLIGDTSPTTAVKVLKDFTASGRYGFKSQTTSCHVGLARRVADLIN